MQSLFPPLIILDLEDAVWTDRNGTSAEIYDAQNIDAYKIALMSKGEDSLQLNVDIPEDLKEGDEVTVGEAFSDVESVKAVSDVYSPVSGTVSEINEELLDAPETINEAPYDAWFVKVKDVTEKEELLSAEEYKAFVESEQA